MVGIVGEKIHDIEIILTGRGKKRTLSSVSIDTTSSDEIRYATRDIGHNEDVDTIAVSSTSGMGQDEDTYLIPVSSTGSRPINETSEIRFLVSSRHLALASGYFKSCLSQEGWKEGQPSEADGMYHLNAADWDPDAMEILLNILHLRNRKVPRKMNLEMLAKMAVLIDYYRCAEAVELYTSMWVEKAKISSPIPCVYTRNLVLWMWIAWTFKLPDQFKTTTKVVIEQSKMPTVHAMDIPIPQVIIGNVPTSYDI